MSQRMIRVRGEHIVEARDRLVAPVSPQQRRAAAERGVRRIFASVETVRFGERPLAREFRQRVFDVVLRESHEPEQPVQSERGVALAAPDLPILDRRAVPEDALRVGEMTARHVNHRRLEVGEGEVRIELERRGAGAQPFVAPRGVAEAKEVAPVAGLEGDRAARRADRAGCVPGADEDQGEAAVRLCEGVVELDGLPSVREGAIQEQA